MLLDGDGLKHSTNGTWMLLSKPMMIEGEVLIKAGKMLFKATPVYAKQQT